MGPAPRPYRGSRRVPNAGRRFAAASNAARSLVNDFAADTAGATAIEYALIAGLISIVIVAAVGSLGSQVLGLFQSLIDKMN